MILSFSIKTIQKFVPCILCISSIIFIFHDMLLRKKQHLHFLLQQETYHCALALVSVFQRNCKPLPLSTFTQATEIVRPNTSYPLIVSVVVFPALRSAIVPAKEHHRFISRRVSTIANWLVLLARVNFQSGFLYSFVEKPFSGIFSILFRASNNQI